MKTAGNRVNGHILISPTGKRIRKSSGSGKRLVKRSLAMALSMVMAFSSFTIAHAEDGTLVITSDPGQTIERIENKDFKNETIIENGDQQDILDPDAEAGGREDTTDPADADDEDKADNVSAGTEKEETDPTEEEPTPDLTGDEEENENGPAQEEDPIENGEEELPETGDMDEALEEGEEVNEDELLQAENAIAPIALTTYTLTIPHTGIGNKNVDPATVEFNLTGSGVTALENPVMITDYDEDVVFELDIPAAGTYTLDINCISDDTDEYYTEDRTCRVVLSVAANGTVTKTSMKFLYDGAEHGTQSSFITTYPMTSMWSEETMDRAQEIMDGMTLEEKVGQLFLVHYPGDGSGSIAQATDLINQWHPGGYLVFAPMFNGSTPDAVRNKTAAAQAASSIPMIFSVDEEGGKVTRISSYTAFRSSKFPAPQDLASAGVSAVMADAVEKAALLSDLGLHVNLAPVADVSGPTGYVFARTYGGDGLFNAQFVAAAVAGHEDNGVATAIKHFPGYGGTSANTHNGFAVNTLRLSDFEYNDLLPFYAGMGAGGKSVMVTHNIINAMDTEMPASISAPVISYLRNVMGFDGVVMTDDLNMEAITMVVGSGHASLAALKAGVDMPMTPQPDKDIPVVLAAIASGELPLSRVEESCLRILCWKIDLGLLDAGVTPPPVIDEDEAEWTSANGSTVETGTFADMWAKAVAQGGTVKLLTDVDTTGDKSVPAKNITLDLNGHKLMFRSGTNGFVVNGSSSTSFTITDSVAPVVTSEENPEVVEDAAWNSVRRELVYYTVSAEGVRTRHNVDMDACGSVGGNNTGCLVRVVTGTFSLSGGTLTHKARAIETSAAGNVVNIQGGSVMGCGNASGGSLADGGAILLNGGTLNISDGYIGGNAASTRGGAICANANTNSKINMTGGVIAANRSNVQGGAIYLFASNTFEMSGGTAASNRSSSNGGCVYSINGTITISGDSLVTDNQSGNGGGIFAYSTQARVNIQGGLLSGNTSTGTGGGAIAIGVGASAGHLNVTGGVIAWNTAQNAGGGIMVNSATSCSIADVLIHDNTAETTGGGIALTGTTSVELSGITVTSNTAGTYGGGVYHDTAKCTLSDSIRITSNTVNGRANNAYLTAGKSFWLKNVLAGTSRIGVTTATLPTEGYPVDVADASNALYLSNSIGLFRSDVAGYSLVVQGNNKIVLALGSGEHEGTNVEFDGILFQYYANVHRLATSGDDSRRLTIIDTSGGVLPANGTDPVVKYLYLDEDGNARTETFLSEIYTPIDISKDNLRPLSEMNKFAGETEYYQPVELWIADSGQYGLSVDADDWHVYPWSEDLRLTTDPSDVEGIYVDTGSVVRIVCDPISGRRDMGAVFYDYDITSGEIYDSLENARSHTNGFGTSNQLGHESAGNKTYVDTYMQGINSEDNYSGSEVRFAFGNSNMQTGLGNEEYKGAYINKANRNDANPGFSLCSFGLVTGLDDDGHLIYAPGISAPKLFDEGEAVGKTMLTGYNLDFVRLGDSYTLDGIFGNSNYITSGLSQFGHPGSYTNLWTNNFWPLDHMGTFGTDGHDLVCGGENGHNLRFTPGETNRNKAEQLMKSDDGKDHNAYFGMQFVIEFDMESDYVGPMEYYFFGDDDMWVFLDGQLISDVGGVHSSVGSYVNLWDWLDEDAGGMHRLSFFYTERGASGSTCWMQFNIPHMRDVTNDVVAFPGSLRIEKTVEGIETDEEFEFTLTLDLSDAEGNARDGAFTYIGSKSGTIRSGDTFTLANGEYIIVQNLPEGTTYSIRENEYRNYITTSTGEDGTTGAGQSLARFTNSYRAPTGTLRISKTVIKQDEAPQPPAGPSAMYAVEWYDINGPLIQRVTREGVIGQSVSITDEDKQVPGYTFDQTHPNNIVSAMLEESGTVLKLYFIDKTIFVTFVDGLTGSQIDSFGISAAVFQMLSESELSDLYPAPPVHSGYTFIGWSEPIFDANGNPIITAQWEASL